MLDFEMSAYIDRHLTSKGIHNSYGQKVTGFDGDRDGSVKRVVLENGALDAGLVLLAVGRRPNVALAQQAGLEIGAKRGVAVNSRLQTSDPAIYAGGDCVENIHLVTGQKVLAPLGSTANKHGRIIGSNITGGQEEFPGVLNTAVAKVFDCNVARTGLSEQEARAQGYEVVTCLVPGQDSARYYPGNREIILKMVAEKGSGRLLGGQVVGPGEAAKRIDVLATALTFRASVGDLANLDLAYAPPYNNAMDPVHQAANVIRNKLSGMAEALTPMEVEEKIKRGEDFILLDVRSPEEWESNRIDAPQTKLVPLDKVRQSLERLSRNKEIITYCQASVRAYQALRILKGAGFKNVKMVDGSLAIWPYGTKKGK
jgi:rhodanese-related sulfurtransferase